MNEASTQGYASRPSVAATARRVKPTLSFWQIWTMCFGFLGLQFAFGLQNANVSAIFQTLGAKVEQIPSLWIAAPLTGLLVQPLIGYMSDRTWTRLGRRKPYFLTGAVLAAIALWCMPRSPVQGLCWRPTAAVAAACWLRHAKFFYRDRRGGGQRPAMDSDARRCQ
jgi:maltose/moltooligosaccharide transporter